MSFMKQYLEIRKLEAEADVLKAKARYKKAQADVLKAETDQLLVKMSQPSVLMSEIQSLEPDIGLPYSIQCSDTGAGNVIKQNKVDVDSGLCSTICIEDLPRGPIRQCTEEKP